MGIKLIFCKKCSLPPEFQLFQSFIFSSSLNDTQGTSTISIFIETPAYFYAVILEHFSKRHISFAFSQRESVGKRSFPLAKLL